MHPLYLNLVRNAHHWLWFHYLVKPLPAQVVNHRVKDIEAVQERRGKLDVEDFLISPQASKTRSSTELAESVH
ncbi:hypothetical protein GOP47_0024495 [Adiantum capillus-veneris]|uniref:Uncharacterized protein n=1 Tax=Adiantum capillus-veneris TaxID=13818 RepID=A0A9D4U339_ADICA|nr:hypothetical protein GOP47_0024495 [Adiantum capillus-veneris]